MTTFTDKNKNGRMTISIIVCRISFRNERYVRPLLGIFDDLYRMDVNLKRFQHESMDKC